MKWCCCCGQNLTGTEQDTAQFLLRSHIKIPANLLTCSQRLHFLLELEKVPSEGS